ncbi:protein serine/threonine phosphatase 2C [Hyaloscypha variabilis F]|uniref:Protein phosphatase n=1 Tax=Hyaloscypha variabilis (strain UAMH 11265 / GT02V1 / F) TaxID=1149755 RepID=A0A2J6RSN2_HYAVF|nr:protein serine/threonine phosphatase 2C [Hyaloscypha variabilis F]
MASPLRSVAFTAGRTANLYNEVVYTSHTSVTRTVSLRLSRQFSSRQTSRPSQRIRSHQQTSLKSFHTSPPAQSNSKFTYGIAASFSAKDERYNLDTNVFNFNPYNRILARRKDKRTRPRSGQDAFFISRVDNTPDVAFGIADGVGGWADSGVDPADFAHGFCDYMAHAAYTYEAGKWKGGMGARALMQRGYEDICRDNTVLAGGSTACVGVARGDGGLEIANLGDSGFVQLRLNAIHSASEPQTHAFNTPYQLSIVPEKVLAQAAAFGGEQLRDFPKDANVSQHKLRHGDVIVLASDGVWDNLSSQEILKIVSRIMLGARAWEHTEDGVHVGKSLNQFILADDGTSGAEEIPSLQSFLAVGITGEAKAASVNTKKDGPFAKEVQKYYPYENWKGGKVDDICVVVAVVCEEGK